MLLSLSFPRGGYVVILPLAGHWSAFYLIVGTYRESVPPLALGPLRPTAMAQHQFHRSSSHTWILNI